MNIFQSFSSNFSKSGLFVGFSWLLYNTYKKNEYAKTILNKKKYQQNSFRR